MEASKENNDDLYDKIEILSSGDEKLKFLGELLSNESSRKILLMLTDHEMSANELSEKTNLRLSLIIHHINKMQQIGLVKISKIGKNSKNHDVKYYLAKSGIIILPQEISEKAKISKSLSLSLKRIMRFSAIIFAGIVSWLIAKPSVISIGEWNAGEEISNASTELYLPIIIGLSVIIIGMIIERIFVFYKK
ncbi:MAG: ArsR family transcriptional regulator [Nitrosarchaeum sp.]